jgi:hypothetical protein
MEDNMARLLIENNALKTQLAELKQSFDHLRAVYRCSRCAWPRMRDDGAFVCPVGHVQPGRFCTNCYRHTFPTILTPVYSLRFDKKNDTRAICDACYAKNKGDFE